MKLCVLHVVIPGFRAVEPDVTVEHSKSDKGRKSSSKKKSRGDQISSNCLMDVRLQEEGETLDGVPPWHPDDNIVVTVRKNHIFPIIVSITSICSNGTPIRSA